MTSFTRSQKYLKPVSEMGEDDDYLKHLSDSGIMKNNP